jgi:CRISPR/Cas system-associated protein Cas7 (RAMP superfamily)
MISTDPFDIYDLALTVRVRWQAHSLSTAGTNGSNRLMPRRQLLSNGQETDACSGSIAKHHHAALLAEYCQAQGIPLCPACTTRDGRRAAALVDRPAYKDQSIEVILQQCALCDAHGFLVTAKKAPGKPRHQLEGEPSASHDSETEASARERKSKHSLIEYSFALALPDQQAETLHIMTRMGASKEEGQMLMKMPARSGEYALCVRYRCVGIGVDLDRWTVAVTDQNLRRLRHRAILAALRDSLISPEGALTATMLPHLTGLFGAISIQKAVGRAPMYSALCDDFVAHIRACQNPNSALYPFESIGDFYQLMTSLMESSSPCFPPAYQHTPTGGLQ